MDAAKACAAIDFLAGELSSNPRWVTLSPLTKMETLRARDDVRRVLGVTPGTPSTFVVDALLRFAAAWHFGDQAAAMQALRRCLPSRRRRRRRSYSTFLPSNRPTSRALRCLFSKQKPPTPKVPIRSFLQLIGYSQTVVCRGGRRPLVAVGGSANHASWLIMQTSHSHHPNGRDTTATPCRRSTHGPELPGGAIRPTLLSLCYARDVSP